MPLYDIGTRVGVILSANHEEVKLLGYGVYAGNFVPPSDSVGFAAKLHNLNVPNPRIDLDSGDTVWGCECWWGPEAEINDLIGERRIVEVSIEEERAKYRPVQKGKNDADSS